MSNQRWKNLERDTADHFDHILKRFADEKCAAGLGRYGYKVNQYGKLIDRNRRGEDFSVENSDVDVVTPNFMAAGDHGIYIHDAIGGPVIVECKYRQGNPLPRLFNNFAKSRPSSLMTPMMILFCSGNSYMVKWLADFQHRDWKHNLNWDEIWITSQKINKSNTYIDAWLKQAESYIPTKAKKFEEDPNKFIGLAATRGAKSRIICIQRI